MSENSENFPLEFSTNQNDIFKVFLLKLKFILSYVKSWKHRNAKQYINKKMPKIECLVCDFGAKN